MVCSRRHDNTNTATLAPLTAWGVSMPEVWAEGACVPRRAPMRSAALALLRCLHRCSSPWRTRAPEREEQWPEVAKAKLTLPIWQLGTAYPPSCSPSSLLSSPSALQIGDPPTWGPQRLEWSLETAAPPCLSVTERVTLGKPFSSWRARAT